MKKQDLTQGSVPKSLIKYAVPVITTSLFQSVYCIVDIVIAGHYIGGHGIAAINNASLILNLMTQIAIGFTVGGNILIGQYFGARNKDEQGRSVWTLFLMSMIGGITFGILIFLTAHNLLAVLGAPALKDATLYLQICALAMPFIFGYNAISSILRAMGNSKVTMYFIVVSSCLNVVLDFLLVAILHTGILGAAFGTVISQGIAFLIAFLYLRKYRKEYMFGKEDMCISIKKVRLIVKLGFPIALQWTVASISWLGVAFLINKYGVDVSAGNGISNKIKDFCQLFISAVVSAGATMAAQNLGAGEYEHGRKIMWVCMKLNLAISTVLIVLAEVLAPTLVGMFTSEQAVIQSAVFNLRIEIIAQWFYAGFLTFNVLATGSGDTVFVMVNSFLNCILVRLVLAFVLRHFLGVSGVYLACMIAPLSSVPVGYWYYKSEKWKKSMVEQKRNLKERVV